MLERSEIKKIKLMQQQLYKRKFKGISTSTSDGADALENYQISEVFIKPSEKLSLTEQLEKSAESLAKALTKVQGRTIFTLSGNGNGQIKLFIANSNSNQVLESIKSSTHGTLRLEKRNVQKRGWGYYGAVVYTSALNENGEEQQNFIAVLEAFLKSNFSKKFELKIIIQPTNSEETLSFLESCYEEAFPHQELHTSTSSVEGTQYQEGENISGGTIMPGANTHSTNKGIVKNQQSSEEKSVDYASYAVEKYCEQLKFLINRQMIANSIGQFQVGIYVGANDRNILTNLQACVQQANFEQEYGEQVQLRTDIPANLFERAIFPNDQDELSALLGHASPYTNVLTSKELARLIQLPSESYDGYEVKKQNDFEVAMLELSEFDEKWIMGKQFIRNIASTTEIIYPYKKIRQHCLISGITGSGKTNTVLSILKNSPVSYLVIEPTKQEYRHLLSIDEDIKIYTLGNELISPIRFNPFYFPEKISVMSHIDSLKAVFMSAFSMYASMPNILEQCLYSIYQKVGWDLNTSVNVFATEGLRNEHFPTLALLYEEIDDYLSNSGYAEEQKSNIRAALLTRLKSLMTGSKGKLLNTVETIDFSELLQSKTVIELEEIADEDDKALIMGLFFIRLSEQFKVEADPMLDAELKHITVIEEAHRLFKNHSENQNPEIANTKGKAVEFFCNILSEIRAKGEGIIIVDQVPTKLAPDALKNTDTKIIHRLVSQDDAEYVAQSLAISEEEDLLFLSQLKCGEILFFTSGMYKSSHILVNREKDQLEYVPIEKLCNSVKKYNPFVQHKEIANPIAEYLLSQNESFIKYMIRQFKKLYHNMMYGNMNRLNEVIQTFTKDLLKHVIKFGYNIPGKQEASFLTTFLKGLLNKFLREEVFFAKYTDTREEVQYYFDVLLSNLDYQWSKEELEVFNIQREKRIYPRLEAAIENALFAEPKFSWMESSRKVVDGDVIYLSRLSDRGGLTKVDCSEEKRIMNVEKMYTELKKIIFAEFIEWHWNEQTKNILWRIVAQIFGVKQEVLLEQIEIWIERDAAKWTQLQ